MSKIRKMSSKASKLRVQNMKTKLEKIHLLNENVIVRIVSLERCGQIIWNPKKLAVSE
jgi:hypothetical protein